MRLNFTTIARKAILVVGLFQFINVVGCTKNLSSDSKKIPVMLFVGGDDSLTLKLANALEKEFGSSKNFTINNDETPETLIVTIPTHLEWKKIEERIRAYYIIKFSSVYNQILLISAGSCFEDDMLECVNKIIKDANVIDYEINMGKYKQSDRVFDFNSFDPEKFLEFLKKDIHQSSPDDFLAFFYPIMDPLPNNWIKPEHLSELVNLIDSKEPCRAAVSVYSPVFTTKLSTIGDEAIRLIQGFRENLYPPMLPVSQSDPSEKRSEILQWWNDWSKNNNLQK